MALYNFDSHKLQYHPERISIWQNNTGIVYPLYLEISPTNACNYSCQFCALDYCSKNKEIKFLSFQCMDAILSELSQCGLKSILYSGAGEPFMHPDMPRLIKLTHDSGIDTAVNTNMLLFVPEKINECLAELTWLRISINAGAPETYSLIHKSPPDAFHKVLSNIEYAVEYKKKHKLKTTIGTQIVLIDDNIDEIVGLTGIMKKIGVDYFSVKPFNPHPKSGNICSVKKITAERIIQAEKDIAHYQDNSFSVVFRKNSFMTMQRERRNYCECNGLHFITFIKENGEIFPCLSLYGNKEYCYGNINDSSFHKIWTGQRRQEVLQRINDNFIGKTSANCRPICRFDSINENF